MRRNLFYIAVACAMSVLMSAGGLSRAASVGTDGTIAPTRHALASQAESEPFYRVHSNAQLRTAITNWGVIGNLGLDLVDSLSLGTADTLPAPSFESPPFSGINYLFEAGLWIGGLVGGDTLVSTAAMDWPPQYEVHPPLLTPPIFTDTLGDQEFSSVAFDTLTDPAIVREDEIDGLHRSLPIRVEVTSRLVDDPAFDRGLVVDVTVTNIGGQAIEELWLGWHVDADVGAYDNINRWRDDLSGFRDTSIVIDGEVCELSASWSADNSGDPDSTVFDDRSPLNAIGLMHLGGIPALPLQSFNWWRVAFVREHDWGPSRNPGDTNSSGGYGRMVGDAMRYRRMSNEEIDYDQVYSTFDFTSDGWNSPTRDDIALEFANGTDTRYLHTRGGISLTPGGSVTSSWAFALGTNFHSDPRNFADNFDADAPDSFIAGLNFSPLDSALARLKMLLESQFHDATIGPPGNVRIAMWDDSTATIAWRKKTTSRLAGYNIYRSLDSISFPGPPVASIDRGDSTFVDPGLIDTLRYYYRVTSVDSSGREGLRSAAVDVIPNRPAMPILFNAYREVGAVRLEWATPLEADVSEHAIYRRKIDNGDWTLIATSSTPESYVDHSAENAVVYEYRIAAISELKTESFPSNEIIGLTFSFVGDPLVIDYTLSGPTSLTNRDSVAAAWQRITSDLSADYRNADPLTTVPFGLDVYDPHPATIVVSDGRAAPTSDAPEQSNLYMYASGAALWTGRDLFNDDVITEGYLTFGPGDFAYDNFGITRAYYPRVLKSGPTRPNAEFIGARPLDSSLPELTVDPSRTDWGMNPVLPSAGNAIPFVGYFDVDTSMADVVYSYVSRDSSTSLLHGRPVAVVSKVPGVNGAATTFPFSYLDEATARAAVRALLARIGWVGNMAGDIDGDGVLTVIDLSMMIDYLFAGGSVNNLNNIDVNGDCKGNLIDVVWLIDALFFGGGPLLDGCIIQ